TAPLGSTVGTGQSIRRMLPTPSEQMEQYSELEKRFRQSQGTDKPLTDQEALQRLREMKPVNPNMTNPLAPKRDNASDARPGGTGAPPAAAPGGTGTAPGAPAAAPGGARAEPLAIKSLATGVRSKTLAQVLTSAEDQMRQGKYADALNQYTLAEQAAPNNGLITLGRANAELGSSSYRTAESHLRQAYGSNGALLLGRYDLRSMIGADRLTAVTKDLTDLSAKEQKETMAPFLLAYISFNTGDAATAEKYLDEVDRRAGAPDPLVKQMRQLWAAGDAGSRNK
ncbi:MAG: repeat protein, partial [Phycisphaerales bacterium]|nr:repeat protein [Phycisphaerales bacterium]